MFEYSAKKNKANGPAAYSMLKPDTSSDSPSVRSNGARLVSANVEMYHIIARGQVGRINQIFSWVRLKVCRVKPPVMMTMDSRIRPRVISYEIVCATARSAPMRAYFEFEAQPEPKIVYTIKLEMAKMNSKLRLRFRIACGRGRGIHMSIANVSAAVGISKKSTCEEDDGRMGSFVNSLRPSAMGCKIPKGPTMLGPLRSCM